MTVRQKHEAQMVELKRQKTSLERELLRVENERFMNLLENIGYDRK